MKKKEEMRHPSKDTVEDQGERDDAEDNYLIYEFEGWSFSRLAAERKSRIHFLLGGPHRYVTVILLPARGEKREKEYRERDGSSQTKEEAGKRKKQLRGGWDSHISGSPTASTVFQGRRLICLDSPCYHAGGPLGEGDIVELEDLAGKYTPASSSSSSYRHRKEDSHGRKEEEQGRTEGGPRILCIRCPWHRWLISLETGEEVLLYPPNTRIGLGDDHESGVNKREGDDKRTSFSSSLPAYRIKEWRSEEASRGISSSRASPPNSFTDGEKICARIGKRVQRLHYVEIDDEAGIMRIMIERNAGVGAKDARRATSGEKLQKSVLRSDELAMSLKNGGRCMEIQDIKSRGLD